MSSVKRSATAKGGTARRMAHVFVGHSPSIRNLSPGSVGQGAISNSPLSHRSKYNELRSVSFEGSGRVVPWTTRTASCLAKIIPLPLVALRTEAGTATLSVINRWGSMGEFEKATKSGSIAEEESPLRRALTFNARAKRTTRSHRRRSAVADILHHLHQTTLPIAVARGLYQMSFQLLRTYISGQCKYLLSEWIQTQDS